MRTDIPVQVLGFDGTLADAFAAGTAGDATNNHSFTNTGNELVLLKNDDASAKEITIVSVPDSAGRTGDLVVSVPAGGTAVIGPLVPSNYNQSGGVVNVDLDADTSVTLAVVRFDRRKSL